MILKKVGSSGLRYTLKPPVCADEAQSLLSALSFDVGGSGAGRNLKETEGNSSTWGLGAVYGALVSTYTLLGFLIISIVEWAPKPSQGSTYSKGIELSETLPTMQQNPRSDRNIANRHKHTLSLSLALSR